MSGKRRILVIEDNESLAEGIEYNLELEGYDVVCAHDGRAGLKRALAEPPDLVILDIMLPGLDGYEVLEALRSSGFDRPVILLTARGEEADRVRGFRLDADQYVTKPFGLLELLERVGALLRRDRAVRGSPTAAGDEIDEGTIRFGNVEVDPAARTVRRGGRKVSLTPRAFDLLLALIRHEGRVLTRQDLLREVWGHLGAVVTRTVDSHISEIRQNIEEDPSNPVHVHTVWKVGYRFER